MFKKKIALFTLSIIPIFAYATDIHVINNTESYGTGQVKSSPCSSILGDKGIAKPHGTLSIPSNLIELFCQKSNCEAHIFASKNCSGKEVGSATLQVDKGVLSIKNNDPEHYKMSSDGFNIIVEQIKPNFMNWLKSFFG